MIMLPITTGPRLSARELVRAIELHWHQVDGATIRLPIELRPVLCHFDSIVQVQSAPTDMPTFPFNRVQHVIARHTAAAINPRPGDGMFSPEWSSPAKLQELANLIYLRAGPASVGASKVGSIAYIAGVLMETRTSTGITTPKLIGLEGPGGAPTPIVVLFITSAFEVHTMYPTGPIVHYYGDDWS